MTVFILIIIALLLILLNVNAIRKEKRSFSQALDNKSQNITDYEVELGKLRKEFAETILELQKEIEELKVSIKGNGSRNDEEWAIDSALVEELEEEQEILEKNDSKEGRKNDSKIHGENKGNAYNSNKVNKADKENIWDSKLKDSVVHNKLHMKNQSEIYGVQKSNENNDVTEMKDPEISNIKDIETHTRLVETYNNSGKKNNKAIKGSSKNNDKSISNNIKNTDKKNGNNKSVKLDEINRMLQEGLSIDEIAEKVGMGKGEVLLIKELYIR